MVWNLHINLIVLCNITSMGELSHKLHYIKQTLQNCLKLSFIAIYCERDNNQCRLSTWAHWAVAMGPHKHRAHANLGMFCTACFLMFKH